MKRPDTHERVFKEQVVIRIVWPRRSRFILLGIQPFPPDPALSIPDVKDRALEKQPRRKLKGAAACGKTRLRVRAPPEGSYGREG